MTTTPHSRQITLAELLCGTLFIGALGVVDFELIGWPWEIAIPHMAFSTLLTSLIFWISLKNSNASIFRRLGGLFIMMLLIGSVSGAGANVIYERNSKDQYYGLNALSIPRPDYKDIKSAQANPHLAFDKFLRALFEDLKRQGFVSGGTKIDPWVYLRLRNNITIVVRISSRLAELPDETPSYYDFVDVDTYSRGMKQERERALKAAEQWRDYLRKYFSDYRAKNSNSELISYHSDFIRKYRQPIKAVSGFESPSR